MLMDLSEMGNKFKGVHSKDESKRQVLEFSIKFTALVREILRSQNQGRDYNRMGLVLVSNADFTLWIYRKYNTHRFDWLQPEPFTYCSFFSVIWFSF